MHGKKDSAAITPSQVGIKDVAAAAGVSVTTVSHILNDVPHTRASDETRLRVRTVASELGYRPNRLARGLRTSTSEMIGLITEEIATTPHAGRIILGAQEAASERNLTLAIINMQLTRSRRIRPDEVRAFIERHADGIMYATVFHDVVETPKELDSHPAVLIGARAANGLIPSVIPDERSGASSVVEFLIGMGHHRIAFLASSVEVPATNGRLLGFSEAMREAGHDPRAVLIEAGEPEASGGYEASMRLLTQPTESRPTAIFGYNDRMAMGVYRAATELGLRIPTDVSIVGFDDQAPLPTSLYPALTTVALPHYEMGAWAVGTLAERLAVPSDGPVNGSYPVRLGCPIVHRDSVSVNAP